MSKEKGTPGLLLTGCPELGDGTNFDDVSETEERAASVRTEVRVRRANGFRMLEMYEEAEKELSLIRTDDQYEEDVLAMQVAVRQDAENWEGMREAARILRRRRPEAVEWWIADAYATRRSDSLGAAREILMEAETVHESDPGIKYNLACYACRSGDMQTTMRYLLAAIALDDVYKGMAFEDEDLVEARSELRRMGFAKEPPEENQA